MLFVTQQFGQIGNAIGFGRRVNARQCAGCGHEIPESRRMIAFPSGLDNSRPAGNHGHPDAALVEIALDSPERGVAQLAKTTRRISSVVAREYDQCFFGEAELTQFIQNLADSPVQIGDHGGIALLAFGPVLLFVGRKGWDIRVALPFGRFAVIVGYDNGQIDEERVSAIALDKLDGLFCEQCLRKLFDFYGIAS